MIGGPDLLICLPLVAETKSDLLRQAKDAVALDPDLLEWRADAYGDSTETAADLQVLSELRAVIGNLPLVVTCRADSEGGLSNFDAELRLRILAEAAASEAADVVDVEMGNDPGFVQNVIEAARRGDTRLILSVHYFDSTPDPDVLYSQFFRARDMGADIAKVAVMPSDNEDVLALLGAAWKARTEGLGIPMAAIAMGAQGIVTRLAGGLFGSDITFAVGAQPSAPGQIPIERMRSAMRVLYESI